MCTLFEKWGEKVKKKLLLLMTMSAAVSLSTVTASAQENYIPLRKTFEGKSCVVEWTRFEPDTVYVKNGDYTIEFTNGSDEIITDEGTFKTKGKTYIENGVTYISEDVTALCDNLYLYHNAILDAVQADEDEILPLKPIDKSQDKVLVGVWNKYPDSYPDGQEITTSFGEVWVFLPDELYNWGHTNGYSEDMTLRMEQLIGLPPQKGYTHFTFMWVSPEDLYRPSANPSIDTNVGTVDFPEGTDEEYINWYNGNAEYSYNPHKYPWTRLGYTYDWADNGTEYGLSEYILKKDSKATVEKTVTNEECFGYITGVDKADN